MPLRHLVWLPALLTLTACEPWSDLEDYTREDVPVFWADDIIAPAEANPTALKVMVYNFKYGAGRIDFFFDYWGDRSTMTLPEVEQNMAGLYRLINEVKPDILLAQEVDVNSKRSAYYEMLQGTLDNTHLNYGAFYEIWDSRYAPDEGTGRLLVGNATFSTYKIDKAERIRSEDRTDQAFYESYLLMHRCVGRAEITAGSTTVAAYNIHAEAYDFDGTKKKHVDQAHELLSSDEFPAVLGGDFNNIPPSSVQTEGFNDEPPAAEGTRYENPPYAVEAMQGFYDDFVPAISLGRYGTTAEEQQQHFSHTVISRDHEGLDGEPGYWNRKLDYMWIRPEHSWQDGSTETLQAPGRAGISSDPMELSDHCPVIGTWEFGS